MCLLNDEQLAVVTMDVKNEGINYSHLSADLIDHVCCDIELRMEQGISFELAYKQVKKEFGIKGLRRIQQDTLMLIDKNYRIMKNSMKLIGVIALVLMAFGALFKIMHWPFAGPMLILSFCFISVVFFPVLLYVMYKEVNQKKQTAIYIVAFFGGITFMAGILFKIMHWPGGGLLFFLGLVLIAYLLIPLIIIMRVNKLKINKAVFLVGLISLMVFLSGLFFKIMHWPGGSALSVFGSVLLVFLFIPLFYFKEVRLAAKIRSDFLFGIIAFTYFIVFSFLLSFSDEQAALIDLNYQNKSYVTTTDYFKNVNSKLLKESDEDLIMKLSSKTDHLCKQIEDIKVQVIQNHYQFTREEAIRFNKSNETIYDLKPAFFSTQEKKWKSPFPKLKTEIKEFNKLYKSILVDSLQSSAKISPLLDVKERFDSNFAKSVSWEIHYFWEIPPDEVLNTLSLMQYNIRLAENIALSAVVTNNKKN